VVVARLSSLLGDEGEHNEIDNLSMTLTDGSKPPNIIEIGFRMAIFFLVSQDRVNFAPFFILLINTSIGNFSCEEGDSGCSNNT
jgi:hypothetical protein